MFDINYLVDAQHYVGNCDFRKPRNDRTEIMQKNKQATSDTDIATVPLLSPGIRITKFQIAKHKASIPKKAESSAIIAVRFLGPEKRLKNQFVSITNGTTKPRVHSEKSLGDSLTVRNRKMILNAISAQKIMAFIFKFTDASNSHRCGASGSIPRSIFAIRS